MHQNSSAFNPRKYLKEATKAMSANCVARDAAFGTAGNESQLWQIDLEEAEDMEVLAEKGVKQLMKQWQKKPPHFTQLL